MKVKIIKKSIKQGVSKDGREYCIKSLYVSFDDTGIYNNLKKHLTGLGAAPDKVDTFCKPKENNGKFSYAFGLNCSNFTFDKVAQFGILDAKIVFMLTETGFINAKIQIADKVEQVLSYEEPESDVTGWAASTTHTSSVPEPSSTYSQEHQPQQPTPTADETLPF